MIKRFARKLKYCTGFKGCKTEIYCGQAYYQLRRKKVLCEKCGDQLENKRSGDRGFIAWLFNKIG